MAFWCYMLRCSDGRYYTGHTEDLEVRLAQHKQGYFRTCWTFKRRPVELVWSEAFPTRYEALEAERMVGGWSAAKKEALIRGDWTMVSYLARPPRERQARFSTSLETNGVEIQNRTSPLVSSAVEKRSPGRQAE
jgi:putative endonuclease